MRFYYTISSVCIYTKYRMVTRALLVAQLVGFFLSNSIISGLKICIYEAVVHHAMSFVLSLTRVY